ncbi:sterol desaturase family protein [Marinobacter lacisalsi]|uniref:Sterol desaturase family protein n=1 Tax=Marinobacter lacisalsi TaxID=475979 RepID=A0ABV8QE06_9GAMM
MPQLFRSLVSRGYLYVFLLLAIVAIAAFDYDSSQLFLWFLLPYYALGLVLQFVMPKHKKPLEQGELLTDVVSNGFMFLLSSVQNLMVTLFFGLASSSLLIHFGLLSPSFGLSNLPMWAQVICGLLIFDFMFYTTHRMAHTVPALWKLHSVHHSAHRVTLMNAYRVHPLDVLVRRFIPVFVLLQSGISQEGFVAVAVIGSVLATITHLNIDLKHGALNYLIGTNEIHRWHHSTKMSEAKNFGGIMIWDHLFGTFYYPKDRDMPEKLGLSHEQDYPLNNYWQQLIYPFRKPIRKPEKAGSAQGQADARPNPVAAET